jgi:hypothetical protein
MIQRTSWRKALKSQRTVLHSISLSRMKIFSISFTSLVKFALFSIIELAMFPARSNRLITVPKKITWYILGSQSTLSFWPFVARL